MEKTYLDYFNYYLKQFLNEIISYFPYTKNNILENYRKLLEGTDEKNDLYVKYFMTKANNHLEPIAKKNNSLFDNKVLYLVEGVNLHELWNSSDATDKNKQALWKYLQLLVLLGRKCVPNKSEIMAMLNRVGGVIEVVESLDKTLEKPEVEEKEEEGGLSNLMKGLGSLASLGKGGGDGMDLGDGLQGIMKLAQTLSESLKDIDMEALQKQMNDSMSEMASNFDNENSENQDNIDNRDNTDNTDTENVENKDSKDSSATNNTNNNTSGSGLLNSSLFGDLAEEMANTFDFEDQDIDPNNPPDMGEVLGNFMKGDNPKKFMNMISKFGNQLQNDIKNGKINQDQLLRESQQMMGNLGQNNIEEMQKQAEQLYGANSPQANRLRNNNRNASARERLQKKHAQRQLQKQSKN